MANTLSKGKIAQIIEAAKVEGIAFTSDPRSGTKWAIFPTLQDAQCIAPYVCNRNLITAQVPNIRFLRQAEENRFELFEDPACQQFVSIMLDDDTFVLIKNTTDLEARQHLLNDTKHYKYLVSFKDAEYHGYVELKNLDTDHKVMLGGSVFPFAHQIGAKIMRYDDIYDFKYFRGNILLDGVKNPKINKASSSVSFLVEEGDVLMAFDHLMDMREKFSDSFSHTSGALSSSNGFVNRIKHFIWNHLNDKEQYDLITNNCHVDAHSVYKAMGLPGHCAKFIPAQWLDLRDIGKMYDFWLAYGTWTTFTGVFKELVEVINHKIGLQFPNPTYWYNWWYDSRDKDADGNTAMQQAMMANNHKLALKWMDVGDLSSHNNQGHTMLHTAAAMPASPEKIELMKAILAHYPSVPLAESDFRDEAIAPKGVEFGQRSINATDLYNDYTPLSCAVLSDDPEAIKLLVEHGADLYYINGTHDNLASVAIMSYCYKAAAALHEMDPNLLYFDNLTRQIPLHVPQVKEMVELQDEALVPAAKNDHEEYLTINSEQEIESMLSALIAPLQVDGAGFHG